MTISCPLCQTSSPVISDAALTDGSAWQCARCGHHWDAVRLATAAAYAEYAQERSAHSERVPS